MSCACCTGRRYGLMTSPKSSATLVTKCRRRHDCLLSGVTRAARSAYFSQPHQRDAPRPVPPAKISRSTSPPNHLYNASHPVPLEGRRPASATLGQAAVDAMTLRKIARTKVSLRTVKSCGPDAPVPASSFVNFHEATVATKPVTGASSYKP